MKNIIRLLSVIIFLLGINGFVFSQELTEFAGQCAASAGDEVVYLKDFPVKLEAATPGGKPPDAKFTMILNKGNAYRFTVCTAPESEGEAILDIYELNKKLASTYKEETGQDFHSFDFNCQKTGVYHIFISFKDGKSGEAVGIMSFVERL